MLRRTFITRRRIVTAILSIIVIFAVHYFGLLVHLLEVDYSKFSYPLDVPMEDILVALKKGEKPSYQPLNEYNYEYKIRNSKKCLQGNDNDYEKVVILYIIKSALNNKGKRDAIRRSWGWENRFSDVIIRRIFMLGTSDNHFTQEEIDEEYLRNRDLVQADFRDSYYNNTIKTMLGFKWVVENCPKAQFIVFSDDDMYVSTKNLLKFIRNPFNRRVGFRRRRRDLSHILKNRLQNSRPGKENLNGNVKKRELFEFDPILSAFDGRLYAGYVFSSSPMRHKSSKWYISLEEYPYSRYPPYVTAGAYILSYPALEDMYYASMFTKRFKFDDVYLGIIAKKCGISPLHNEHFHFWRKDYSKEAYANVIASHGFNDPEELKVVWEEQRSAGHA